VLTIATAGAGSRSLSVNGRPVISGIPSVRKYSFETEASAVKGRSARGLGGCPYAPGATGNVATEDVVYMLEGMGIATGVDMTKLVAATNVVSGLIGRPPVSRVAAALNAKAKV